jgi:hypothetical protein
MRIDRSMMIVNNRNFVMDRSKASRRRIPKSRSNKDISKRPNLKNYGRARAIQDSHKI